MAGSNFTIALKIEIDDCLIQIGAMTNQNFKIAHKETINAKQLSDSFV